MSTSSHLSSRPWPGVCGADAGRGSGPPRAWAPPASPRRLAPGCPGGRLPGSQAQCPVVMPEGTWHWAHIFIWKDTSLKWTFFPHRNVHYSDSKNQFGESWPDTLCYTLPRPSAPAAASHLLGVTRTRRPAPGRAGQAAMLDVRPVLCSAPGRRLLVTRSCCGSKPHALTPLRQQVSYGPQNEGTAPQKHPPPTRLGRQTAPSQLLGQKQGGSDKDIPPRRHHWGWGRGPRNP